MKIRSITCLCQPDLTDSVPFRQLEGFRERAAAAFEAAGFEVQTTRLATTPFPEMIPDLISSEAVELVQRLESAAKQLGFAYLSLGPASPEQPESFVLIPIMLAASQDVFFSGLMTTINSQVSLPAVRACGEIIHQASSIKSDGFTNLRFAAMASVPAGTPFFPAAYHSGGAPVFALALEAADLAVQAFESAASLSQARQNLVFSMEYQARRLEQAAQALTGSSGMQFGGIDFSLAPFPQEALSLGTAMEGLGVPALGLHGSLAAAAVLADTMDQAQFARTGFCGLMLPVLEDATLARRAADGSLGVKDMLTYSAVCGTGLDTVPLPGDATPEQLSAILLDLAALSVRLRKPLTARLMPVPGKKAGDFTGFDFAFFANSRVLALEAQPLQGHLNGNEAFTLNPRRQA